MAKKVAEPTIFSSAAFLRSTGPGKTFSEYTRNEVIFAQGEPADAVFYLQKGNISLKVSSRQGKVAVIGILGSGSFFGEGCLTAQQVRMSTATAMDRCRILRVEKSRMVKVLHEEAEFSEVFLAH